MKAKENIIGSLAADAEISPASVLRIILRRKLDLRRSDDLKLLEVLQSSLSSNFLLSRAHVEKILAHLHDVIMEKRSRRISNKPSEWNTLSKKALAQRGAGRYARLLARDARSESFVFERLDGKDLGVAAKTSCGNLTAKMAETYNSAVLALCVK